MFLILAEYNWGVEGAGLCGCGRGRVNEVWGGVVERMGGWVYFQLFETFFQILLYFFV